MAAVYPVSSGSTSMSGTYTPEIWSGKTLVKFYKETVFGEIANTDYEGEIKKQGDTVHIRTIPDMVIDDHAINDEIEYHTPEGGKISLYINKGKRWAIAIDDIQLLQSDIAYVSKWTDDAGMQLGITIDAAILADVYADAHASNAGATAGADTSGYDMGVTGTPKVLTQDNIMEWIVDVGNVLDEQSAPDNGRFVVMPPLFIGKLKKSDLKNASMMGDGTSVARNGILGMIDTFMIHRSRNIYKSGTEHNIIAGTKDAITFASQLTKNETLKNPKSFGELMRGLQVYGYKVIKPEALVHCVASSG